MARRRASAADGARPTERLGGADAAAGGTASPEEPRTPERPEVPDTREARIQWIFEASVAMAAGERTAFLDRCCGMDLDMRRELAARVEALVAAETGEAPEQLELPREIGPYELGGVLGVGGMGTVHRARHRDTGRRVALKSVRAPRAALLSSLRREIGALARLRHPGIVRILDEGLQDGVPWYAMELVEGTPLRDRVPIATRAVGEAELREALTLARGICAPLAYLHGEGVVHRDLKPDNVLLRGGAVVLVDFGLASSFGGAAGRERLGPGDPSAGTAAYVAPEQILGRTVDARADIYALGCILYELLTGRPPFRGSRVSEVLGQHLHAAPVPPSGIASGIPAAVDDLLLKLLAKEPRRRLGHAGDVAVRLLALGAAPDAAVEGEVPVPVARAYLYQPELAGRGEILARLLERIATLAAGGGGIQLLSAESGAGKTRLLGECVAAARAEGHLVLTGECLPRSRALEGLGEPLAMLGETLRERGRDACARVLGPHLDVVAPYVPGLAEIAGLDAPEEPASLAPDAARLRLFTSLAAVLRGDEQPVVAVVDDLQWADDLTLGFLAHLRRTRLPGRLLVIGAFRGDEASPELEALAAGLGAACLSFGGLGASDVTSMVAGMLAVDETPEAFGRFLAERSEGNPFFVSEYLRLAVDEGLLRRDEGGAWRLADAALGATRFEQLRLPASLGALLDRRLRGLGARARTLAQDAAVVGREVARGAIAHMTASLGAMGMHDALTELINRHVIAESPAGYRFVHDRLREAAYGAIPAGERPGRHRAAALALEELHGEASDAHAAELGRHWQEAGELERAAGLHLRAAAHAGARYALADAEESYRRYLTVAPPASAGTVRARIALGALVRQRGRAADAEAELRIALADAIRLDDGALEAESRIGISAVLQKAGSVEEARGELAAALALCRRLGARALEGHALHQLAVLENDQGRVEEALDLAGLAAVRARECGDAKSARAREGTVAGALLELSRLDLARPILEGILESARAEGDPALTASATHNLAILEAMEGRARASLALLQEAGVAARRSGDRHGELRITANVGATQTIIGEHVAARASYEAALALAREIGDRRSEAIALGGIGCLALHVGRREEARSYLEAALAASREIGDRGNEALFLENLADLLREEGRFAESSAWFAAAMAAARQVRNRPLAAWCLCQQGRVALLRGELARARELCAEAERLVLEVNARPELGQLACTMGHLELASGASAARHLARARECVAETGARPESDLSQRVATLERAEAALGAGEPLVRGYLATDLTPGERAACEGAGRPDAGS